MNTDDKVHPAERPGPEKRLEFEKFLGDLSARFYGSRPRKTRCFPWMIAWPSARIPIQISEGWNLINEGWIG